MGCVVGTLIIGLVVSLVAGIWFVNPVLLVIAAICLILLILALVNN